MWNYKELLFVVFISGAMFGVGMKSAESAIARRKILQCQSNLKGIYELALKYQNDHAGYIVSPVDKTKYPWRWWYYDLLQYTDDPTIFYCPANPKAEKLLKGSQDPLRPKTFGREAQSYGINAAFGYISKTKTVKINIKDVKNPGYLIYFGDSKGALLRGTKWCWKKDYAPRHENKSNFALVDGSVKLMNHENLGLCQKWKHWGKDRKRWIDWE